MKITTDIQDLIPTANKSSGGYEWWYFDGLSEDGSIGFVIIFYHGNPFSTKYIRGLEEANVKPDDFPAVSISIYKHQKTIYYSFLEYGREGFSWNEGRKSLAIGGCGFRLSESDQKIIFEIELDQELESGHSLAGRILCESRKASSDLLESDSDDKAHRWNLLQPKSQVSVNLVVNGTEIKFKGEGYNDHNTGSEPLKESFDDWYWGRYHFRNATLVYYLMNRPDKDEYKAWIIGNDNEEITDVFSEITPNYYSGNWFGLSSARRIEMQSGSSEILVQTNKLIDNGPFYQRFQGVAVMKKSGQAFAAQGISEYLNPNRIYKKQYWPLIHMRIRFMSEKPHWVQKSKLLYRWTW